jgi:hypothetical protein
LGTKHANKITTNQKKTYHKANTNVSNDAWTIEEITPIESGRASVHVHSDQSTARIFNGSLASNSVNRSLAICTVVQFEFGHTVEPASTERSASIALRMQPPPPDTTDLHSPPPDTTALQLRGSLQAVQMPIWTAIDIVSTPQATILRTVKTIPNTSQHAESWRAGRAYEHARFPQFGQHSQYGNQSGLRNGQDKGS